MSRFLLCIASMFALSASALAAEIDSDKSVTPYTTLHDFIRSRTQWRGTKRNCGEGGCGACCVTLTTPENRHLSVNSCIRPVLSCNGMAVTTVVMRTAPDCTNSVTCSPRRTTIGRRTWRRCTT